MVLGYRVSARFIGAMAASKAVGMGCTAAAGRWIAACRYAGGDSAGGVVAASDLARSLVIPGTHPFRKSAEW
ncbi:MAG: hypothetical protein DMG73_21270, partial [Acidobacteria bacterium]